MKINHAFRLRENKPNQTQFQRQKNAAVAESKGEFKAGNTYREQPE